MSPLDLICTKDAADAASDIDGKVAIDDGIFLVSNLCHSAELNADWFD